METWVAAETPIRMGFGCHKRRKICNACLAIHCKRWTHTRWWSCCRSAPYDDYTCRTQRPADEIVYKIFRLAALWAPWETHGRRSTASHVPITKITLQPPTTMTNGRRRRHRFHPKHIFEALSTHCTHATRCLCSSMRSEKHSKCFQSIPQQRNKNFVSFLPQSRSSGAKTAYIK